MPSLSSKDRVSLCRFTFEDGRRCRTPRISTSPDFCFYHAKKEAQLRANESLAEDLAYFFSGDYLSANDLNTALSRVFVAVARGELKPRAARTLAYLAQTMFQTLHLAQNEFITACGEKDWRETVVTSINANHNYRFPNPTPQPTEPVASTKRSTATPPPPPTPPRPTTCHPACPEERRERSEPPRQNPIPPTTDETPHPITARPSLADTEAALKIARSLFPDRNAAPPKSADPTPSSCHAERNEGPRLDPASPRTDETQLTPVTPDPPATPIPQPAPSLRSKIQTPDPYAVHYGPEYRLIVDGKPFSKHT
jgi:hypothetical protein